jgi:hypothetical protein
VIVTGVSKVFPKLRVALPNTNHNAHPIILATQQPLEQTLRCLRADGDLLSSLAGRSSKLQMPYDAFASGLGDHRLMTTLCPAGKERMRRLIEIVRRVRDQRAAIGPVSE